MPGAWLRCSAGELDKESDGSGELSAEDTSLSAGEEEVFGSCRWVLLSGSAGAGISAFLAMARGKPHASEIDGGRLNAAGANSLHRHYTQSDATTEGVA